MKAFWVPFALCLVLCALGVPPAGDTALGQEDKPAAGETAVSKDLRGKRYTEIFLIGEKSTEVYNTSGLNDSPPDKVKALDGKALAKEYKVPFVFVNGPRFWTMDQITGKVGKTAMFGDLDARWVGQLKVGHDFFTRPGAREPYRVGEVARDTTYYVQGRQAGLRPALSRWPFARHVGLQPHRGRQADSRLASHSW